MSVIALISALLALSPPQDDPCASAQACRTVAFTLTIDGQSYPYKREAPQPWITPDGRLMIFPGESVVVSVAADETLTVLSARAASAVVSDAMVEEHSEVFSEGGAGEFATEDEVVPISGIAKPEAAAPQTVRVTFYQAPETGDMFLLVQNGYGDSMEYDAAMIVRGREGAQWTRTSVCTVLPTVISVEHWPHLIYGLSLGGFGLDPALPKDAVRCR